MEDEENRWSFFIRPGTTCFATITAPKTQKMLKMTLVLIIKSRAGVIATRFKTHAVVKSDNYNIDGPIIVTHKYVLSYF